VKLDCAERLAPEFRRQLDRLLRSEDALLPESDGDARTAPIYKKYPTIETTVLAAAGQVSCICAPRRRRAKSHRRWGPAAGELEDEWATLCFRRPANPLEEIVGYYLKCGTPRWPSAESRTGA